MSQQYIKTSAIKKLAKANCKRAGKEFINALDRYVEKKVMEALREHNGGKKTLDSALAGYILGIK